MWNSHGTYGLSTVAWLLNLQFFFANFHNLSLTWFIRPIPSKAIASMGGAFLDCNHLFSKLSGYSKLELCSLTIFNLTARQDLQIAFDQMSQLISPPTTAGGKHALKPITLRGLLKNRTDLGLSVSLVKGEDGIAKCFCVVLTNVPQAPFDNKLPSPVSFESLSPLLHPTNGAKIESQLNVTPTYTTG